jgi:hypothetical protein
MAPDIMHSSYSDKYYKSSIPISWLKEMINKNRIFKIDMSHLYDYFGDIGEDPETVYNAIKKILLKEGIIVDMDIEGYKLFLTFSFNSLDSLENKEEKSYKFLDSLFGDTKYLLCPKCNRYSVEYYASSFDKNDKKWWCNHCIETIVYSDYHIDLTDRDKYQIYKLWGVDALSIFTKQSMKKTVGFVASYFRDCCIRKKDKCLYFDFFKKNSDEGD